MELTIEVFAIGDNAEAKGDSQEDHLAEHCARRCRYHRPSVMINWNHGSGA